MTPKCTKLQRFAPIFSTISRDNTPGPPNWGRGKPHPQNSTPRQAPTVPLYQSFCGCWNQVPGTTKMTFPQLHWQHYLQYSNITVQYTIYRHINTHTVSLRTRQIHFGRNKIKSHKFASWTKKWNYQLWQNTDENWPFVKSCICISSSSRWYESYQAVMNSLLWTDEKCHFGQHICRVPNSWFVETVSQSMNTDKPLPSQSCISSGKSCGPMIPGTFSWRRCFSVCARCIASSRSSR